MDLLQMDGEATLSPKNPRKTLVKTELRRMFTSSRLKLFQTLLSTLEEKRNTDQMDQHQRDGVTEAHHSPKRKTDSLVKLELMKTSTNSPLKPSTTHLNTSEEMRSGA